MLKFYHRYILGQAAWGTTPDQKGVYLTEIYDKKTQTKIRFNYWKRDFPNDDPEDIFNQDLIRMNRAEDDFILYTTIVCEYAYGEPVKVE